MTRLTVAALLGAVIGFERERGEHHAGLRTHMLVALAAALFVFVPLQMGIGPEGLSRVVQGVVAGAGFIGMGAVLKRDDDNEVRGLTTAAGVWLTAAVGIAVGLGREATAILSVVLGLAILTAVKRVDHWIHRRGADAASGRSPTPPR